MGGEICHVAVVFYLTFTYSINSKQLIKNFFLQKSKCFHTGPEILLLTWFFSAIGQFVVVRLALLEHADDFTHRERESSNVYHFFTINAKNTIILSLLCLNTIGKFFVLIKLTIYLAT